MPSAYTTILQQFYLAYFGRPADPVGLQTTSQALANAGAPTTLAGLLSSTNATVVALINNFGSSAESTALYTGTTTARVTEIYRNVLNRDPDVGGLLFWSTEIDSGRLSLARVALAVIEAGARDVNDGPVVLAKTNVAISYTAAVDTVAEINAYNGSAAAASARTLLRSVVATTTATNFATNVATNIENLVANNGGAAVGSTLTLTAAADTITGTTSNDTFVGTFAGAAGDTFTAADTINGAAGIDTLNITTTAAVAVPAALVSNIELVNIRATGGPTTASAANFVGATGFSSDRGVSAVTISDLAAGQAVSVNGDGNVTNGAATFKYAEAVTSSTLNYSGGTKGAVVTITGPGITSQVINSAGATNATAAKAVTLAATTTAVTINAATALSLGAVNADNGLVGIAANGTVTVTGAGTVDLNTLVANVKTVTATGNTGGVTVDGGVEAGDSFTGGSGNDTVTLAVALTTGAVAGGAGTGDRVVITDAAVVATAAAAGKVTQFEILREQDAAAGTYDLALLAGVTSIEVNGTANATFKNVALTGTTTVLSTTPGDITVELLGVNPGGADAYTINIDNGIIKNANGVDAGTILVANVDTLTLNSVGANLTTGKASSVNSLAGNTDLETVVVTGNTAFDLVTGASSLDTINGSAFTGVLRTSGGASLLNITGGTGNDVLAASSVNDVINGGAGNDTIFGGVGADGLTGGAGTDTFVFATGNLRAAAAAATDTNAANFDRIVDFDGQGANAGDVLRFGTTTAVALDNTGATAAIAAGAYTIGALAVANGATATVTAVTVATAADFTALLTAAAAAITGGPVVSSATVVQAYDVTVTAGNLAGRFLILNDATAGFAFATDDIVSITGVVGALNANDFVFQA